MSSVVIAGDTSGSVTLQAPAVAGTTVLTLPSTSGTLSTTSPGMTLVSTLTASSSASLEWTGLTGANTYMLVLNTILGSANQTVAIQFGTGAGPTYLTTGYTGGAVYYSTTTSLTGATTTSAYVPLHLANGNTAPISGSFFLAGMQGNKPAATGTSYGGTATDSVSTIAASVSTTGPITAVKLYMPTGNLTSGTAALYKLAA